jgi:hypothetical protein
MSSLELMTAGFDVDVLKELAGMVDENEAMGNMTKYPTLKINYDEDSAFPRGTWVVGQKKDEKGIITEQGEQVEAMVVVATRNRRSYYDREDTKKNAGSILWGRGETHNLDEYYKKIPDGKKDKFQIVIFAVAITKAKKAVDCVAYLGGSNYMPWSAYFEALTTVKTEHGKVLIPPFAYVTLLEPITKERNEGVTFFVAGFKKGPRTAREHWPIYEEKRLMAKDYVAGVNEKIIKDEGGARSMKTIPAAPVAAADFSKAGTAVVGADGVIETTATVMDYSTIDLGPAPAAAPVAAPAPAAAAKPESVPATELMDEGLDIEAAVAAALGKTV